MVSNPSGTQSLQTRQPVSGWYITYDIYGRAGGFMQPQQQSNWCWAAVSSSASFFFNPNSNWTQCNIVNAELNRSECCTNGSNAFCNVPWYLERALTRTVNLQSWSSGAGSLDEIKSQININRPLCLRIGWRRGGGHVLAVIGYYNDGSKVIVDDPIYGYSEITLYALTNAYQGSGQWTHKYYVKP